MKKKEWKRLAKNAEFRAAGVTVAVKCETMGGLQFAQIVQRGTTFQMPVTLSPGSIPVLFTIEVG